MKKTFKLLSLLAVTAIMATSCKKDNVATPADKLSLNGATASVTTGIVYSPSFTTPLSDFPGSTGNWGTTYFDFENNTTTSSTAAQAIFNGAWDGVINPAEGYTLAYKDFPSPSTVDLSSVSLSDLSGTTTASSLGYNTPGPGWYTYVLATHANGPVEGRIVVLYEGTTIGSGSVYAIQLNTITSPQDGSTGKYYGNVSFNFKKLN